MENLDGLLIYPKGTVIGGWTFICVKETEHGRFTYWTKEIKGMKVWRKKFFVQGNYCQESSNYHVEGTYNPEELDCGGKQPVSFSNYKEMVAFIDRGCTKNYTVWDDDAFDGDGGHVEKTFPTLKGE